MTADETSVREAQPQRFGHPARFSDAILNVAASYLAGINGIVLDPFAGTGRIHELRDRGVPLTIGFELEPEWADMHPDTICLDARDIFTRLSRSSVDAVFTSPAYGNRMADHHDARDGSHRNTYKHMLGRDLTEGNAGAMEWGPEYRRFHALVWGIVVTRLRPDGLFLLNIKDHIRKGEVQHVAAWHVDQLCRINGLRLIAHHLIPTRGLPSGENAGVRVDNEEIYVFTKETR